MRTVATSVCTGRRVQDKKKGLGKYGFIDSNVGISLPINNIRVEPKESDQKSVSRVWGRAEQKIAERVMKQKEVRTSPGYP